MQKVLSIYDYKHEYKYKHTWEWKHQIQISGYLLSKKEDSGSRDAQARGRWFHCVYWFYSFKSEVNPTEECVKAVWNILGIVS